MSGKDFGLEVVEEYELLGEKRYRLRIAGTSIYINVAASSRDEAFRKAREMIRDLELDKLANLLSSGKEE